MAKNTGKGQRSGSISGRTQTSNPNTLNWTKRSASSGQFRDGKFGSPVIPMRRPWWCRLLDVLRWHS